ncbi:hypothetical protein DDZ13_00230 [Coraliomargarita sinensis]|uniref:PEP-CTERM sorting domain-containing protein n=1 Tax=Coraliomargarita sinensis TaxID=2174842 RepID=A0A317ZMB9_9BACT|nr:hypothetical protein [Coraliomargarita sinensis]PXA05327.1 hypothetical protein DDZ13_00230 [Coraliomargarita sinensis]
MKNRTLALFLAASSISLASESVVIFQDDFSTDTLATGYAHQGATYNATPETVTLQRGYSTGNYLQVAENFNLDTGGTTELTIAFDYAFSDPMYGATFAVEYNDNSGTGWQTIDTIDRTSSNTSQTNDPDNPYSITIEEGQTYNFADGASIRIRSIDTGGGGYHFDNLTVSADNVAEPTKGTVIMISSLGGWFVLMFGFIFWREIGQPGQSRSTSLTKFETQK